MTAFDTGLVYPFEAEYWQLVEATLVSVFDMPAEAARVRVADLERLRSVQPAQDQLLGFHAEPLSVAAKTLGLAVDDTALRDYLELADRMGWGAYDGAAQPPAPLAVAR